MKPWLAAICLCSPFLVQAQRLTKVEFEPDHDRVRLQQDVTVRIDLDSGENKPWCGLRVNFGDGDGRDERVEQVPVVLHKRYTKPGVYTISVEGKTLVRGLKTAFSCMGSVTSRQLEVVDPQVEEAARLVEQERQRKLKELADREARVKASEEAIRIKAAEDAAARKRAEDARATEERNRPAPVRTAPPAPSEPPVSPAPPTKPSPTAKPVPSPASAPASGTRRPI